MNELKKQVDDLTQSSSHQRDALDEYEQYSRRNSLRIWIKEKETPGEVTNRVVTDYAKKLEVELQPGDIDRTHRVGKLGDKPRPIIVKFTSYAVRRRW